MVHANPHLVIDAKLMLRLWRDVVENLYDIEHPKEQVRKIRKVLGLCSLLLEDCGTSVI